MAESANLATDFTVQDVLLRIPNELLTPAIDASIRAGRYEAREAQQLARFLTAGDRVLEFGGGLGFMSTFAAKRIKLASVVVIEANPFLIPVMAETHALNGVSVEIINAVALSEPSELWAKVEDDRLRFYVSKDFWGSSLTPRSNALSVEKVPVVRVSDLVAKHQPTIIVCDIEGGEIDLMDGVNLATVRLAMFEVHKSSIGLEGINRLTLAMALQGLYYDPDYSMGPIVTYARPMAAAQAATAQRTS